MTLLYLLTIYFYFVLKLLINTDYYKHYCYILTLVYFFYIKKKLLYKFITEIFYRAVRNMYTTTLFNVLFAFKQQKKQ